MHQNKKKVNMVKVPEMLRFRDRVCREIKFWEKLFTLYPIILTLAPAYRMYTLRIWCYCKTQIQIFFISARRKHQHPSTISNINFHINFLVFIQSKRIIQRSVFISLDMFSLVLRKHRRKYMRVGFLPAET